MGSKRGQLTLFIILGLILLVIVGLTFWVASLENEVLGYEAQQALEQSIDLYPPQKFVEYCVQYHVPLLAQAIAKGGGTQFPRDKQSIDYKGKTILLWYTQQFGNTFLTRQQVAQEIQDSLPFVMQQCLDTRVYEQQGYEVTKGPLVVNNVTINDRSIFVKLRMPLELRQGEDYFVGEDYAVEYAFPFGALLDQARDLTNAYVQGTYVDTQQRMVEFPYIVQRDRPYPYTVYTLNTTLDGYEIDFSFGIEENDPFGTQFPKEEGCCFVRNTCYAGTTEQVCTALEGFYNPGGCVCDALAAASNQENESYADCSVASHGDQWCESVEGVGGRFVKQFCHDGTVFSDVCKDYRQELCVTNQTQAKCRENVYDSCSGTPTQALCEDTHTHDCVWISDIVGCRPAVSPGLPFWRSESAAHCSQASILCKNCNLDSGDALQGCLQIGDCGSTINAYGTQSTSDTLSGNQLLNTQQLHYMTPSGSRDIVNQQRQQSISVLLNGVLQTLDELSQISIADYLNPFKEVPFDHTQVSYCQQWQAPRDPTCQYCMNAQIPCSEYLCKSLGEQCIFANVNGSGFCFERGPSNQQPPKIVGIVDQNNVSLAQQVRLDIPGYVYSSDVGSQHPLKLTFETSSETRCKLTYLPQKSFDEIGGIDLSGSRFTTQHELDLFFVSNFEVLDRFLEVFDSTSYQDLVDQLVLFKAKLENLAQQYPLVARFKTGYYPLIAPLVDYYLSSESTLVLDFLIQELEKGQYYMYISCIDQAGQQNQDTYVTFAFVDECQDTTPPRLMNTTLLPNGSLSFYADEVVACRYDAEPREFAFMRNTLPCATEIEDFDVERQAYRCSEEVNLTNLYISCADHPERMERIPLAFELLARPQNDGLPFVREHIDIFADQVDVNISALQGTLVTLDLPGAYSCMVGNQSLACTDDSCQILIDDPGIYGVRCIANVDRTCGEPLFTLQQVQQIPPLIPLRVVSATDHVLVQIANATGRGVECEAHINQKRELMDKENEQTFKLNTTDFYIGRTEVAITCSDSLGASMRELVVVNK